MLRHLTIRDFVIVDRLELVQVNHQHGKLGPAASCALHGPLKTVHQQQAVGQTGERVKERMLLERLAVVAAMGMQKFDVASSSLDYLLSQKSLTDSDRLTLTETAVSVRQRAKDYPGVVDWARKYVQLGGKNPRIRLALIQSLSIQGLHKDVVAEIQRFKK